MSPPLLHFCVYKSLPFLVCLSHHPFPPLPFLLQIRYRKDKVQSKLTPTFPLVSAVKDLSNGCAIAAVVHYYCPALLALEGTHTNLNPITHIVPLLV